MAQIIEFENETRAPISTYIYNMVIFGYSYVTFKNSFLRKMGYKFILILYCYPCE